MAIHAENDSAQTIVTTIELAALAIAVPPVSAGGQPELQSLLSGTLSGVLNVTAGAATTAVTIRVRHGINTITGAVIGNPEVVTLAAAASADIPFEVFDAVGDPSGYTVTVQQTAATGNGTVNSASMDLNQQLVFRW